MMGYFSDSVDLENYEPYEVIQAIMEQFTAFRIHILQEVHQLNSKHSQLEYSKKLQSSDS
jgi:hypothetical protein